MDNFNDNARNVDQPSAQSKSRLDVLNQFSVPDFKEFFMNLGVIVRLFCLSFSLIVVCSISSQGWEADQCKFNYVTSTCNFASFLATMSILFVLFFLLIDSQFHKLPNVLTKKYFIIGDFVTAAFLTFLWFASFCDMADKRRRTSISDRNLGGGISTIQAAIAFAFFAIVAFAISAFLSIRRYREVRSQQDHIDPSPTRPYNTPDPFAMPDDQFTP